MAKNFYDCTKSGGRITNKKDAEGKTITFCYDKEGNVHTKNKFKSKAPRQKYIPPTTESLSQLVDFFNNLKP